MIDGQDKMFGGCNTPKARGDDTREEPAGKGLAGRGKGGLRDRVYVVETELNLVSDAGRDGVWYEIVAILTNIYLNCFRECASKRGHAHEQKWNHHRSRCSAASSWEMNVNKRRTRYQNRNRTTCHKVSDQRYEWK